MFCKKECIAMLLAGGQGSRLQDLTRHTAKPAVSFGGKYRIIDFSLSNCTNSGIDTVGVLTQYQPLALSEYIGNGAPWDLDRSRGGVSLLPPYQGARGADWYCGTANAIYQNLDFIRQYDPEYVLILSGDHIYRMDYSDMLRAHKVKRASCTVATVSVPRREACRFGICSTDADGRICEFEEKPKQPKNDQASMGIYIFNTETLVEYLEKDEADASSSHDFGKNVIPSLLRSGEPLYSYRFSGYWKDVGTIESLWEANMDLLGEASPLGHGGGESDVYSRMAARPPQFIGAHAEIRNALISEGSEVHGTVTDSVLSVGVRVAEGAEVHHSVIMSDVTVGRGARVYYAIVDSGTVIGEGALVGSPGANRESITVVAKDSRIERKKETVMG
ncbi:MAG: glucose-1-phosphate adenylyltransferase [Clostridia bacterium]|nr:glucose-1-phosphate adenylyltransferase [Clostridia bacterium]